jgi:hypothetical protein
VRGRRGPAAAPAPACLTEAEARGKRDEELRKEIVALGKRYFLLSRHTSLLVLEDDAMYQRYGVTKGAGDTWAPYTAPAKIPVVKTAMVTAVADDAELVRSPLQVFASYRGYRGDFDLHDGFWNEQSRSFGDDLSMVGGAGFGLRGRGELGLASGRFGLIGAGRGGGGTQPATPMPSADRAAATEVAEKNAEAKLDAVAAGPMRETRGGEGEDEDAEPARRRRVTSAELQDPLARAGPGTGFGYGGGKLAKTRRGPGLGVRAVPIRLVSPGDVAYDDLSAFVPALRPDDFDEWRAAIAGGARGTAPHPIDDPAKALLERARRAVAPGVYRWGDRELAVDGARRIGWRRITGADLAETASFDGASWTRRYAELGLDVVRPVGDDAVALALAYLPLWIAEPAHYARWFAVRATGPRQVTLALPPRPGAQEEEPALVLDFDAQDRLSSIASGDGAELVRIAWSGARGAAPASARVFGADVPVGFTGGAIADAPAWAHGGSAPGVVVELPGRLPAFWAARLEELAASMLKTRASSPASRTKEKPQS